MAWSGAEHPVGAARQGAAILPRAGLAALSIALAASANAQSYDTCLDPTGRPVIVRTDTTLPKVAEARVVDGVPEVHHNPQVLPRLQHKTRLFLQARECAHHALKHPIGAERTAQQERRADCSAVQTLLGSGLFAGPEDVTAVRRDLVLTPEEWAYTPGPRRVFDLEACHGTLLKMPDSGPPSAAQIEWNACERQCGQRLWNCQQACRSAACTDACVTTHDQCSRNCGPVTPR